ncbi:hypothetical protein SAMN04489867_0661 [Pedococcus dokdonensis]|uniref:Uncharacterized protein n=1 Tax=Pedococcus dokdonensis TaxID=443156 RepID=A0A1H0MMD7_9MICO|nr:hypothetical protein [Pedococcus dokdonensis]SDO81618.1 hypothetical protein SAMN04489867_0661 [Pedococcus dokdonensis]
MSDRTSTPVTAAAATAIPWRSIARWMVTFAAFPLGSLAARLLVGSVDAPVPALLGGLLNGVVLGIAQAWAVRDVRLPAVPWAGATATGFATGLVLGAAVVGYATDARSLVVQGAVTGGAVGLAQATVLGRSGLRPLTLLWPVLLAGAWALGWAITTAVGVEVGLRFTVFGSSGAVVVAALTLLLPVTLRRASKQVRS